MEAAEEGRRRPDAARAVQAVIDQMDELVARMEKEAAAIR
jgi:hypothetical protein